MDKTHLGTLTGQIKSGRSPLRRYLDARYPHASLVVSTPPSPAPPVVAPPQNIVKYAAWTGTAFDLAVRFLFDKDTVPDIVLRGFTDEAERQEIIRAVRIAQRCDNSFRGQLDFASLCHGLARCVDAYRIGADNVPDIVRLRHYSSGITVRGLSHLIDETALDQFLALWELFHRARPFDGVRYLGPDLSNRWLNADADLVTSNGVLVDLKTTSGKRLRDGSRVNARSVTEILQIVTYALLDTNDRLGITAVGIYSARWGTMTTWNLTDVLSGMRGEPTNATTERMALAQFFATLD